MTATTDGHSERSRPPRLREPARVSIASRLITIAVAASCALAAVYLGLAQRQAADLQHARDLARSGGYGEAVRVTDGVSGSSATAASAVKAEALARAGGGAAADRAFAVAVRADPTNWQLRRDWAVLLLADGLRQRSRHQMEVAHALNPRITLPPEFYVP